MTSIKNWLLGDPSPLYVNEGNKKRRLNGVEEEVAYIAQHTDLWPSEFSKQATKMLLRRKIEQLPPEAAGKITPLLQINAEEVEPAIESLIHEIAPNTTWTLTGDQNLQTAMREAFINALSQNQLEEAKKLFNLLDKSLLHEILDSRNNTGLSLLEQAILISNDAVNQYIYNDLKEAIGGTLFPEPKEQLLAAAPQRWVNADTTKSHQVQARQTALARINECRNTNGDKLDLKHLQLNSFPAFLLLGLSDVKEISFRFAGLTTFTFPPDSLPNLTILDLSQNSLVSITVPQNSLTNLEILNLEDNRQLLEFPIPRGSLTNLHSLNLHRNQLKSFSIPPGGLKKLKFLNLRDNEITQLTIPQDSLIHLKGLDLSFNKLSSFSIEGVLLNLEKLDLSDNNLNSFTIAKDRSLIGLTNLRISNNPLINLPQALQNSLLLTLLLVTDNFAAAAAEMKEIISNNRTDFLKTLLPPSARERYIPQNSFADNFCQFIQETSDLQNHAVQLLSVHESIKPNLTVLVETLYDLIKNNRLDENSLLGQQVIHYKTLISSSGDELSPWNIYRLHLERLHSEEKLPLPRIDKEEGPYFNYHALTAHAAHEERPAGINFARLQGLIGDFKSRFESLDDKRKGYIIKYLKATIPQFDTIDTLLENVQDPWWATHLNAPTATGSTLNVMHALAYICTLSSEAGMELPDEETLKQIVQENDQLPEEELNKLLNPIKARNFLIQEKLLSPKETGLLKLIGQVQNCNTGKENGVKNFLELIPGATRIAGTEKDKISEAIRVYLCKHIINTNDFLRKLLISDLLSEPLHQSKFIRNRLSKELRFPLEFDLNSRTIATELLQKPPQELLRAVFAEVQLKKLCQVIAETINESTDWKSNEGIELFQNLKKSAPPEKLIPCCNFDDEGEFLGISDEGIPYLLEYYGFFSKTP